MDIHSPAVSKLQSLLVLEAEHGPLPGTTPAVTDVINYLENVNTAALATFKYRYLTHHSIHLITACLNLALCYSVASTCSDKGVYCSRLSIPRIRVMYK